MAFCRYAGGAPTTVFERMTMPNLTRFEKLQQVVAHALTDSTFAEELRVKAAEAQSAGVDTDEWEALGAPFARNPAELATLRTLSSDDPLCTHTTSYLLNAGSTVVCTLTTTTTTTSFFCPEAEATFQAKSKRKPRQK